MEKNEVGKKTITNHSLFLLLELDVAGQPLTDLPPGFELEHVTELVDAGFARVSRGHAFITRRGQRATEPQYIWLFEASEVAQRPRLLDLEAWGWRQLSIFGWRRRRRIMLDVDDILRRRS